LNSFHGNPRHSKSAIQYPELPFILPALVIMTLLFLGPILFTIGISFTNFRLGMKLENAQFVYFSNYIRLFNGSQANFIFSIYISILLTVLATGLQMILGLICAMVLNRDFPGKGLVIACLLVPVAMTPSIASQMWKLLLNSDFGVINYFINKLFGFTIVWLDADHAFLSVLIAIVWQFTPFVTLMLYAGLRSLPDSPYESAIVDGANQIQIFFHITLPMMKRLIMLCVLLRTVDMLKTFDIPYTLTQGGPGSATKFLGLLIFDIAAGETNYIGRGSAIAVILVSIVCIFSVFLFRALNRLSD
jgi:multiple sugar transport system permease protein